MPVSVSLWSIIHSYFLTTLIIYITFVVKSFRLLTEYHSFLYDAFGNYYLKSGQCFRLLTEYHSFLYYDVVELASKSKFVGFRLLMEYHSFL